ncbi:hypothetical protein A3L09_07035 [Thermococcus profundus]|uniref:Uncharacterized protein n=1 Tax=Thermococcus profundus TaxID=49899 RepID=A0A2Z2M9L4_THEPR|nr:hypothetical protein [Thermococcus profundus]ASJ03027.1 hypothetical protein A3L09_07035 [Thermococcus profundus]
MRGRAYKTVALLLIIFGILVNFVPAASYYFGTYSHVPHKGVITNGSSLDYYMLIGPFPDNKSGQLFNLGLVINPTYRGNDEYEVGYDVYNLSGRKGGLNPNLLPKFPFYASGGVHEVGEYHKAVQANDDLIEHLISPKPLPGCWLNDTFNTFPSKFYGMPRAFMCVGNDTRGMYVIFGDGHFVPINIHPTNATFLRTIVPEEYINPESKPVVAIFLGWGNTVPKQDWNGWLKYGFGISFPLNVGFVIIGILMLIVASRRA